MKKLHFIFALAALLLLPATLLAQQVECLILTQSDGTVTKFALADAPVITFNDGEITVTSGDNTLTTSLEGLTAYYDEAEPTAVKAVKADGEARPVFSFGQARFEGMKAGSLVTVYTVGGVLVLQTAADGNGRASVDLSNLPQGVYILNASGHSYTISK